MSKQIENAIREKRTIEAIRKSLMGTEGKIGTIINAYGTPVMRQGSSMYNTTYLDSYDDDGVFTEYSPTLSGSGPVAYRDEILDVHDDNIMKEGLLFDGLSRGLHLEMTYWVAPNEIKMYYKGYLVYQEIAGELEAYAPAEEWEKIVDKLYVSAKEKMKEIRAQEEEHISQKIMRKKQEFWEYIKSRWGV